MPAVGKYGFINAKVRAMRSALLEPGAYRKLAAAQGRSAFYQALGSTALAVLADRASVLEPPAMEIELLRMEAGRIRAIRKQSRGIVHRVTTIYLERYDGERLKRLLRLRRQKSTEGVDGLQTDFLIPLPVDAILNAQHHSEIAAFLEGTPFKTIFSEAAFIDEDGSLFALELAVDRIAARRLWEAVETLDRSDRKIAERLLGLEVDLKNLEWIGRFRRYYNMPAAQVSKMLLSHGFRLRAERLSQLAAGGDLSEAVSEVLKGSRIQLDSPDADRMLQMLETFLSQVLLVEARRAFGQFPFSIGAILGYITLIRIEMRNIRTLMQAVEYGLSASESEALLVM